MPNKQAPIEKELKYQLTKSQYDSLIKASQQFKSKTTKQINYYFDDSLLRLRKRKLGLRIRLEDHKKSTLTLKEPAKQKQSKLTKLKVRYEWESPLSLTTAKSVIALKKPITSLNKKPIRVLKQHFAKKDLTGITLLGSIKTTRTLVYLSRDLVLEIDKYKMFDQRFYELEVESHFPEKADQGVRAFFKKHRIPCKPISQSKLGRFIDCWKKQKL
jgi:uncharacterized protein YjbK